MPSASPRKPPPPSRVTIDRVGAEGDGIARLPDGTPLYLPLTLPGEHVLARPLRPRGEGWHAVAEAIDAPSPARARPPCGHFSHCGGCVLQHWQDGAYRAWKAGLLESALRGAGFTPPGPIELVAGLPGERRRFDFAVRRAGGRIVLGLHGSRSAEVIDLTTCTVLEPTLEALLAPLRELLHGLRAIRRRGEVVVNLLGSGPDMLLRSDTAPSVEDRTALVAFARAHGLPRVSWAHTGDSPSGASASGDSAETICLLRPAATTLSGVVVHPPPGGFLQATEAGERAIVEAVVRGVAARLVPRPVGRLRIAELYAGTGSLTFALAGALSGTAAGALGGMAGTLGGAGAGRLGGATAGTLAGTAADELNGAAEGVLGGAAAGAPGGTHAGRFRIMAWEGDAASVGALRQAINQGGLAGRIEATQRDLARQPLSAKELSGFAATVLDPPHAGAAAQIAEIAAAGVPTVVYVSCNPATLGRDARALHSAGYTLAVATAIDQFLWSARLESVSVFHR